MTRQPVVVMEKLGLKAMEGVAVVGVTVVGVGVGRRVHREGRLQYPTHILDSRCRPTWIRWIGNPVENCSYVNVVQYVIIFLFLL